MLVSGFDTRAWYPIRELYHCNDNPHLALIGPVIVPSSPHLLPHRLHLLPIAAVLCSLVCDCSKRSASPFALAPKISATAWSALEQDLVAKRRRGG
jgi:hypothetical protein